MSQTKAQLISDLVQALNFTGTSSAPANGMYLSAANTIKLATNSNGRLTIDSSGNATFTGTCTATTFIGALTGTASNASGATGDFSIADKIVHTGDTNTAIRFPSADVITAETAGTERFRIDSGGRISIGNNPTVHTSTKFHVEDTGELNVKFEGSTSTLGARLTLQNNDATANSYCQYAFNDAGGQSTSAIQGINTDNDNNYGELAFLTRSAQGSPPTERIRIDKNGKLGIGTTTPAVALDVQGGTSNTGIAVRSTDTRAQVSYIDNATTGIGCVATGAEGDDFFIRTGSDGAKKLTIKADGKVGIGTTDPESVLQVQGAQGYADSANTLATSTSKSALRVRGSNNSSDSLWMGVETSDANPYIQGANGVGNNAKKLLLNPFGGNVGIGTTSPAHKLHVVGTTKLFGTTAIGGNDDITPDANGVGQLTIDANGYTGYIAANATAMYFGHNSNSRDLTLQTNESDRLTIDGSTGNVGIGTTSPTDKLHVAGNIINTTSVSGTGDSGFQIANGHRLGFDQSGTRSWSIKATGGVLNIDSGDGNSGPRVRGLLFGSDTADANKLDDYEEGTWTPGIAFGGGTTGLSISKQTGYYVKIGRLVNLGGTLILSAKGSSTGSATLTGLPFNVGDLDTSTSAEGGGSFTYWTNMNTDKLDWTLRGSNNSSTADISVSRAGGHTQIDAAADSDFQNSSSIRFIMTYQT